MKSRILQYRFWGLTAKKSLPQFLYLMQELEVGGQKIYAGKYQNVQALSNKLDYRHFIIPPNLLLGESAYVKSYNLTVQKFSIAPTALADSSYYCKFQNGNHIHYLFSRCNFYFSSLYNWSEIQTKNDDFRYYHNSFLWDQGGINNLAIIQQAKEAVRFLVLCKQWWGQELHTVFRKVM